MEDEIEIDRDRCYRAIIRNGIKPEKRKVQLAIKNM